MAITSTKNSVIEYEGSFFAAALTLASAVAAVTIAESLFRVLYDNIFRNLPAPGYYLLFGGIPLVALALLPIFRHGFSYGRSGFIFALAIMAIVFFSIANFRGAHRWPGFYDMQDHSRVPLFLAVIFASAIGYLLSRASKMAVGTGYITGVLILGTFLSWIDAYRGLRIVTNVPFTRHIELTILGLLVVVVFTWDLISNRGYQHE